MNIQALAKQYVAGTPIDWSSLPPDVVEEIKTDTSHGRRGAIEAELRLKSAGEEGSGLRVEHVASTGRQDRDGDRILVDGWDPLKDQDHVHLLFQHGFSDALEGLPLGKVLTAGVGQSARGQAAYLTTSEFHTLDIFKDAKVRDYIATLHELVKAEAFPYCSVGFDPIDVYWPRSEKERADLGLGPWGVLVKRQSLRELSICTIPANQDAALERVEAAFKAWEEGGTYSRAYIAEFRKAVSLTPRDAEANRRIVMPMPEIKSDSPAEQSGAPLIDALAGVIEKNTEALERLGEALASERTEGVVATASAPEPSGAQAAPSPSERAGADPGRERASALLAFEDELQAGLNSAE